MEVVEHGGTGQVMSISPSDAWQSAAILVQSDGAQAYSGWHAKLQDDMAFASSTSEFEARRRFRAASEALGAIRKTDFYLTDVSARANN